MRWLNKENENQKKLLEYQLNNRMEDFSSNPPINLFEKRKCL